MLVHMSLDPSKLKNVKNKGDKQTAQCPACAAEGHDSKGDHLAFYPDGRFGCVVFHGENEEAKAHRAKIFDLVGTPDAGVKKYGPIPVRIRRPACVTRTPKTILVLSSLTVPTAPVELEARDQTPTARTKAAEAEPDSPGGAPAELGVNEAEEAAPKASETEGERSKWHRSSRSPEPFTVAVKHGPGWEERLQSLKAKYTKEGSTWRDHPLGTSK